MWTHFWDMCSGGGRKLKWDHIFIEAPRDEAELIFQNRFGRNPNRVTCTCCGPDYSIYDGEDLEEMTAFYRKKHRGDPLTVDQFFAKEALRITASEIKPGRRWLHVVVAPMG